MSNEIFVLSTNKSKFLSHIYVVNTDCDVKINDAEYANITKTVGNSAYEFIMQFKKVESIEKLIESIENQLKQISNMSNPCLQVPVQSIVSISCAVVSCTCTGTGAGNTMQYFSNDFYDSLTSLYGKLCNVWKCPHTLEQLVLQLPNVRQTLETERTALSVLADTFRVYTSKYYAIKAYRMDVDSFLNNI